MTDEEEEKENENTEYELLAKEIYKTLLKVDGIENIDVQHNIKLPGKSGCNHQIDVYWEFKLAGDVHRVAIECKNFSKEVSIAKVRDFFGVIYDISNIKGIFASKKGFQSGAKKFADYHGISLKEIRQPQEEDWKGRLKTIHVEINIMPTKVTGIHVEPDYDWLISNGILTSEEERNKIKFTTNKLNTELFVYDENGIVLKNFLELENELPHDYKEGKDFKFAHRFDNGYLDSNLGRIKIKYVGFVYDIENVSSDLVLEAEDIVRAIIKDVKSGEIKFVNKDGSVK
jgi:hypothetical protein